MAEPIDLNRIDLDLVELRCRLRGWPVLPGEDEVCCETPRGDVWVRADGTAYSTIPGADRTDPNCPLVALLTAPRWTLERLLSEPPEGWEYESRHERLMWQGDDGDSLCLSVSWCHDVDGWLEWDFNLATDRHHHDMAAFAGQLKAAAELALILAEVSDG